MVRAMRTSGLLLLTFNGIFLFQGCGGGGGGGGGGAGKPSDHPDPPAPPGPCECIGNGGAYEQASNYPSDTGHWCYNWYSYGLCCNEGCPDFEGYKGEHMCDWVWCMVKEDCELRDDYLWGGVEDQYKEFHISLRNCADPTTLAPTAAAADAATTSSP